MITSRRTVGLFLTPMLIFVACAEPNKSTESIKVDTPPRNAEDQAFVEAYNRVQQEAATMQHADLVDRYGNGDYLQTLTFDPGQAEYLDVIAQAYGGLNPNERSFLQQNGFVAPQRLSDATFGSAYLNIYQLDLPVFVTADSILHSVHRTYDAILKEVEKTDLVPRLETMLQLTQRSLGQMRPEAGASSGLQHAFEDADLFLTVARSLLHDQEMVPLVEGNSSKRQELLAAVRQEAMVSIKLFSEKERKLDMSQMKPRGHYAGDEVLERYFRAMMWLGRIDLRPVEYTPQGQAIYQPRQLATAALLKQALHHAEQYSSWSQFDQTLGAFVGEGDSMDMNGVEAFLNDNNITDLEQLFQADRAQSLVNALYKGGYGKQRINSHYLMTDPFSSEPGKLPLSYTFMGQRFVIDSYVFSSLVYDRLVVDGRKILRPMPVGFDALAALGSGTAVELLEQEMAQYPYAGAMHNVHFLVDHYQDNFWFSNMYNGWLTAIRALNSPTNLEHYPQAMRTQAWHRKTVNTQAASWAQLRHDTILYAKQSYTSAAGCDYPMAYVEPRPEFFAAIGNFAGLAATTIENLGISPSSHAIDRASYTLASMAEVAGRLGQLAQKELDGIPFSEDDTQWLKAVVYEEVAGCETTYTGWYPALFFEGATSAVERDLTIADVHTNPNTTGPMAPPRVLHLGTGDVRLAIFTAESCDGLFAYVGPIYSYYEHTEQGLNRLDDENWTELLDDPSTRPQLPEWAIFE